MKPAIFVKPNGAELKRAALLSLFTTLICLAWPVAALAQQAAQGGSALNIDLGSGAGLTQRVVQLVGQGDNGCAIGPGMGGRVEGQTYARKCPRARARPAHRSSTRLLCGSRCGRRVRSLAR